jgi:hypothetical protein
MSNLIKMSAVGAELFHADGRTEGYDEANSHFSPFRERLCQESVSRHLGIHQSG